jgi:hypothetical protein
LALLSVQSALTIESNPQLCTVFSADFGGIAAIPQDCGSRILQLCESKCYELTLLAHSSMLGLTGLCARDSCLNL